eukprot:349679-Chlamydomonas_euryale.AAC.16
MCRRPPHASNPGACTPTLTHPHTCSHCRLAVSLKARRMGIARALTAHAVAAARAAGVRTMFLSTSTAQHAACTMYERDGWKVVSTKAVPVLDLRIVRFELQLKA